VKTKSVQEAFHGVHEHQDCKGEGREGKISQYKLKKKTKRVSE